jgi:UDP-GlcNAc:undecaprenyl-phosphate GlcNAc-1-phosphate transferase
VALALILLLQFLVAMSVTMVLIPPLIRVAGRWRFLDQPEARKVHTTPVPRVGGIAIAAGTLLAIALWRNYEQPMPAICVGLLVLLGFGVWDDRCNLSARIKLIGQIIAVLIAIVWGDVTISTLSLAERHVMPHWVSTPLTFFFLLGVTNAINLADGLDGLAGGTTLLSLSALALLGLTTGNALVATVSIVLIGAILGFLRFNTHPARVFMGDGGSQVLGFAVGVLAILLTQDTKAPLSTALPLLLLGLPIIDTLMVMTQRLIERRSPFSADRNHIHHRLLALGLDHHEAVATIYIVQGCLFVAAWFMRYESDALIVCLFLVVAAVVIGTLTGARRKRWRIRVRVQSSQRRASRLSSAIAWIVSPNRLPRVAYWIIGLGVLSYFAIVAVASRSAEADVRLLAWVLMALLCVDLLMRWRGAEASWLQKGVLYICAVMAVYLDEQFNTILERSQNLEIGLFIVLAAAVAARFRLSNDRRFRVTPLDVLVIIVAIVVPNLPGSVATPHALGGSIAKLVVLFYAIESLLSGVGRRWPVLGAAALAFLMGAAVSA